MMDLGVHLPLLTWNETRSEPASLIEYVRTADRLGFTAVSVNDHLQYRRPWLDGPTALASVVSATGEMTLATTIVLAVVRGPFAIAKSLGAIDLLSGGRLIVGVGPGSYQPDYEAEGLSWEERWPRFEEVIQALRALWRPAGDPFEGAFYSTRGIRLEPAPPTREDRRSGSGAGGRTPGSAGSLGSATDGSPPPTTPARRGSSVRGPGCASSSPSTARTRRPSRTRSPR
jgi:alkanesulfonate monooxygenase SsuD/methylene tetrahydromethanopterin reductase-like flavin-dependent oxidoreductase (luciferase family)